MSQRHLDSGRASNALRNSYLIARREFITRVRTRFFQIGTVVLMLLIGGYLVLQTTVLNRAANTSKVAFVGQAQALAAPLSAAAAPSGLHIEVHNLPDLATGTQEIQAGKLDAVVSGDVTGPTVTVRDQLDPTVGAILNAIVRQTALDQALAAKNLDPAGIDAAVASARIHLKALDPAAAQRTERIVAGIFIAAFLYVALLVYGNFVAQGVVEEKSNRIVELLLSAVSARQLLFGKVAGIGLVGVLQLVLVAASSLVVVKLTNVVSLPSVGVATVAAGLLWFIVGFTFYALLYAAGGSLVSRQEEIASITTPITVLVVGVYLSLFWAIANPDNPATILMSVLPGFAPILMPARMATGDAQAWQVVLAVVLSLLSIAALNVLAARIYSNSVLRTGSRVSLRDAWGRRA